MDARLQRAAVRKAFAARDRAMEKARAYRDTRGGVEGRIEEDDNALRSTVGFLARRARTAHHRALLAQENLREPWKGKPLITQFFAFAREGISKPVISRLRPGLSAEERDYVKGFIGYFNFPCTGRLGFHQITRSHAAHGFSIECELCGRGFSSD